MDLSTVPQLETPRLLLRGLTPEVYAALMTTRDDETIRSFLGLPTKEALATEKEKFRAGMATWNKSFVFFQLLEKATGKIIGSCGFHTWYLQHARAELGYSLYSDADKRKGLMKEALLPIIRYGFEVMQLHRIEAFVGPGNEASLKLIHGLGFTEEGRLREHYFKNGIVEDSVVFSLLDREFREMEAK